MLYEVITDRAWTERSQSRQGRRGVGRLGVVVEGDPADLCHTLEPVRQRCERAQHRIDGVDRGAGKTGGQRGGQRVGAIVRAGQREGIDPQQLA